jgi:hypothetical protein
VLAHGCECHPRVTFLLRHGISYDFVRHPRDDSIAARHSSRGKGPGGYYEDEEHPRVTSASARYLAPPEACSEAMDDSHQQEAVLTRETNIVVSDKTITL